jgi:hypothetical protein
MYGKVGILTTSPEYGSILESTLSLIYEISNTKPNHISRVVGILEATAVDPTRGEPRLLSGGWYIDLGFSTINLKSTSTE